MNIVLTRLFYLSSILYTVFAFSGCNEEEVVPEDLTLEEYEVYSQYISAISVEQVILNELSGTPAVMNAILVERIESLISQDPFVDPTLVRKLPSANVEAVTFNNRFSHRFKPVTLFTAQDDEEIFQEQRTDQENWEVFTERYADDWLFSFSRVAFDETRTKAAFGMAVVSSEYTVGGIVLMTNLNGVWLYDDFKLTYEELN